MRGERNPKRFEALPESTLCLRGILCDLRHTGSIRSRTSEVEILRLKRDI